MPVAATAKVAKPKIIDYTRMPLGRVTKSYKGRRTGVIARCPKCGKRGERSFSCPEKGEGIRARKPFVSVTHVLEVKTWGLGRATGGLFADQYGYVRESCTTLVNKETAADLLNVEERKRYDAFVAELQTYVAEF